MSWKPFCKKCFRFFNGNAPSDFKGPKGEIACCPHCGTLLTMQDEDHPPKR